MASRDALKDLKGKNFDQNVGVDIVRKALRVPCLAIARNAGVEGSVVVENLLTGESKKAGYGYDAQNGVYTDLVKSGIIDPTKVCNYPLYSSSALCLEIHIILTSCIVTPTFLSPAIRSCVLLSKELQVSRL